ncbi:hypothetical protein MAR_017832 [Mya arenaria]|uniref:Uncharacterized protein n=1 Tax=Mya arenaria TaxID=6604 RepID=A0ABY7EFF1_MYAAR|nr:hypothetical protein MAR_017832 [Mya arenaria]
MSYLHEQKLEKRNSTDGMMSFVKKATKNNDQVYSDLGGRGAGRANLKLISFTCKQLQWVRK